MAQYRKYNKRGSGGDRPTRLTGLFASRAKRGLFVGTARPEELRAVAPKIRQAIESGRGLTFFLWDNGNDEPRFNLSAEVANERPARPAPVDDDAPAADDELDF